MREHYHHMMTKWRAPCQDVGVIDLLVPGSQNDQAGSSANGLPIDLNPELVWCLGQPTRI